MLSRSWINSTNFQELRTTPLKPYFNLFRLLDRIHILQNGKEMALLKKMDEFFAFYKTDIYGKASPKVGFFKIVFHKLIMLKNIR